jgi:hypothetical protein
VIIELAGLPGSGKSSIARQLAAEDGSVHRQVVAPAWLGLASRPMAAMAEAGRWKGVGRSTGWPAWPVLWLRALGQQSIRDRQGVLHLLEEGIAHHLWRECFLHPALEDAPWDELLAQSHPLVVLELDRDTRFRRVAGKPGKGKVNRMLTATGPNDPQWDRAEQLWDRMTEEAAKRRTVHRVSTLGSIDDAVERVRVVLNRLR